MNAGGTQTHPTPTSRPETRRSGDPMTTCIRVRLYFARAFPRQYTSCVAAGLLCACCGIDPRPTQEVRRAAFENKSAPAGNHSQEAGQEV